MAVCIKRVNVDATKLAPALTHSSRPGSSPSISSGGIIDQSLSETHAPPCSCFFGPRGSKAPYATSPLRWTMTCRHPEALEGWRGRYPSWSLAGQAQCAPSDFAYHQRRQLAGGPGRSPCEIGLVLNHTVMHGATANYAMGYPARTSWRCWLAGRTTCWRWWGMPTRNSVPVAA